MRRRKSLGVAYLGLLLLTACGDPAPRLQAGDPAPPFTLPGLDGESLAVPVDFAGQVVALRFWADWCPFCATEMRDLEPLYRAYRERGLRVLAINVRQDRETAAHFAGRLGLSYPVLLDAEGAVARAYGVSGLPTTLFLDRQGRVATRILGESTPELFRRLLEELL